VSNGGIGDLRRATTRHYQRTRIPGSHLSQLGEADTRQVDVLRMRTEILGDRHHKTAQALLDMAGTCYALGKKAPYIQQLRRMILSLIHWANLVQCTGGAKESQVASKFEDNAFVYGPPPPSIPEISLMTIVSSFTLRPVAINGGDCRP
jgi:hypothetical protein